MPVDDIYWNSIDFGSDESLQEPSSLKHYVDPWDLENYAYIREQLESDPGSSEANSTSFPYVPVQREQNYAAIDELKGFRPRSRRSGFETEFEENPYEENLKDVSLSYDHKDRWRKVPPSMYNSHGRDRSFSFSYGDYGNNQDIYCRLDEIGPKRESTLPIYDDVKSHQLRKPRNFGLSNYGHLKIDYSYSWNTLDKYICH